MIGEKEIHHGVALARLVQDSGQTVSVRSLAGRSRSAYEVNGRLCLYVKYSTKRLAPWTFEFSPDHAREIADLSGAFPALWLVLVCGPVGVAAGQWQAISATTLPREDGGFSVTVRWRPNHRFRVGGAGGNSVAVADSAYPSAPLAELQSLNDVR